MAQYGQDKAGAVDRPLREYTPSTLWVEDASIMVFGPGGLRGEQVGGFILSAYTRQDVMLLDQTREELEKSDEQIPSSTPGDGSMDQLDYFSSNAFPDSLAQHHHALGEVAMMLPGSAWDGGSRAANLDDEIRRRMVNSPPSPPNDATRGKSFVPLTADGLKEEAETHEECGCGPITSGTLVGMTEAGPDAAEKDEAVACSICKMCLNGPIQYQDHLKGKRHRKNRTV